MKKQEEFTKTAYDLGFNAGRAYSLLSGIIIGIIITVGIFNFF